MASGASEQLGVPVVSARWRWRRGSEGKVTHATPTSSFRQTGFLGRRWHGSDTRQECGPIGCVTIVCLPGQSGANTPSCCCAGRACGASFSPQTSGGLVAEICCAIVEKPEELVSAAGVGSKAAPLTVNAATERVFPPPSTVSVRSWSCRTTRATPTSVAPSPRRMKPGSRFWKTR